MIEEICKLLGLNIKAGIGRRLAELGVVQDENDPNLFYISPKDNVTEPFSVAQALSILAKNTSLRFSAVRIMAYHYK